MFQWHAMNVHGILLKDVISKVSTLYRKFEKFLLFPYMYEYVYHDTISNLSIDLFLNKIYYHILSPSAQKSI